MRQGWTRVGMTIGVVGLMVLGACGEKEKQAAAVPQSMEPVEAELQVDAQANPGEAIDLMVEVTQDGEGVDDADEVKFEVWKQNAKEESELIEATLSENGMYQAETTFEEEGTYTVQVHVTARQMHTMPTTDVVVGEPEQETTESATETTDEHHHHAGAEISLEPTQVTAGSAATFTVDVAVEHEALTEADVQLEIFQEGVEQHTWVKLEETEGGNYAAEYTFAESGTYNVQVHVTKGHDIHEHIMETVEVQ